MGVFTNGTTTYTVTSNINVTKIVGIRLISSDGVATFDAGTVALEAF
jgi:hypothetical protein